MAEDETWPTHSLRSIPQHVNAIGVLSINFNDLENKLLGLLQLYDGAPKDVVAFLFEKVPTEARLDWLHRSVVPHSVRTPELRDCITAFAKAYKACAENRNLIVHSRIGAFFAPDTLMLSRRVRGHGGEEHLDLTLEIIRGVADEIYFWNGFGNHVLLFGLRRQRAARQQKYKRSGVKLVGPTTLPKISLPPANLATQFQSGGEKPPSPPRPSRRLRKAERKKLWKK